MDTKIEKGQQYAVSGTDSGFLVEELLDGGGLKVKWLDSGAVVELPSERVNEYIASGQLKLIDPNAATESVETAEKQGEPAGAESTEQKKEDEEPEASGRLRVKRVVRHIPIAAYINAMKKAIDMSPEEFEALMSAKPKEA